MLLVEYIVGPKFSSMLKDIVVSCPFTLYIYTISIHHHLGFSYHNVIVISLSENRTRANVICFVNQY